MQAKLAKFTIIFILGFAIGSLVTGFISNSEWQRAVAEVCH